LAAVVFFASVAVALLPPLEGATHRTLTAHMIQHLLLISVAAPALALALPARPMKTTRWYCWAALALVGQSVLIVAWHAPFAFDAALRHDPLHGLEHISMLSAAALFWWVLAGTRPLRGEAVVALFFSTVPMTVLGLGLMLSTTPWYAAYRDITDQQVAGAVMWAMGGGVAVVQAVALFAVWLKSEDARVGGGFGGQRVLPEPPNGWSIRLVRSTSDQASAPSDGRHR
jgi:putative membrane protein